MHLIFLKGFYDLSIFFFIFCIDEFYFLNKKYLFSYNISNMCSLTYIIFSFLLFNQFNVCVYFYYHLIE